MVWVLRFLLGVMVVAYATWLGLPLGEALGSGTTLPQLWASLAAPGSTVAAVSAGVLLTTILLYGLGGVATIGGLSLAPGLYFFAFVCEISLRLAVASGIARTTSPAFDLAGRADAALHIFGLHVASTPLTMAALLGLGLFILASGVWRGQKGDALTRVWTQPPVWA